MDSPGPQREVWVLSQDAFDRLLVRLDPDRERAGVVYERLRSKLTIFFQARGCIHPDEYADETINRVARLLEEGRDIPDLKPSYFLGVGRNLLKEYWRKERKQVSEDITEEIPQAGSIDDPVSDRLQACVEECLSHLVSDDREFILLYYRGEKREKIDTKKSLASRLGLTSPQLRKRAFRIRNSLRACAERCCQEANGYRNVFSGGAINRNGGDPRL